jgi:transcriptional regulator with XRE-family HTH domain
MTPDEFRTIRLKLGMTQKALAKRLGYNSHITVTEIEKGRVNITKTLDRLMTAYDEGYVPHADTVSRKAPHDDS